MRMGLRQANQQFARAIRAVRQGHEVVLTDRGKPIAVMKPLEAQDDDEPAVRRLEAAGRVRAPQRRGPLPPWRPRRIRGVPIAATVEASRRERR